MRILVSVSLTILAALPAAAQDSTGHLPDPHRHVVNVHEGTWENELAPDAKVRRLDRIIPGRDSVVSPDGRWRAFVYELKVEQGGRICLEELKSGGRYELIGIPLPYRPLSSVVWLNDSLLAFDRWSQPHHGVHYVLNVRSLRLVLSTPFPDQSTLDRQRSRKDTTNRR